MIGTLELITAFGLDHVTPASDDRVRITRLDPSWANSDQAKWTVPSGPSPGRDAFVQIRDPNGHLVGVRRRGHDTIHLHVTGSLTSPGEAVRGCFPPLQSASYEARGRIIAREAARLEQVDLVYAADLGQV